jgi:hypothetical protein
MGANLPRKKGVLTRRRKVYFLDAAHLLHAAIPTRGWIKRTKSVILKTNSGRNRLNIIGAYSPDEQSLINWEGRESCDAERVRSVGPIPASASWWCLTTRPTITPRQ